MTSATLARLEAVIDGIGSAVVAYSGGVDSSLLMAVAHRRLGARAVAVIADSETLPRRELDDALSLAREHTWAVRVVETREMERELYRSNGPDRCFHCKDELFTVMAPIRDQTGSAHIIYGANLDDALDHRPGAGAARIHGVRAPLVEAGLDKAQVRECARLLGLSNWDRPAFACLSSRVQYGQPITLETLRRVGEAETWLRERAFSVVRVRAHGDQARVEVGADEVPRLLSEPLATETVAALGAIGFAGVVLDPRGYRRGSMNSAENGGHRFTISPA
ncbi:MAG: ATP-dependent sacrificial sulfur transferase LarE [Candidatus Dormibacteria bacterium]